MVFLRHTVDAGPGELKIATWNRRPDESSFADNASGHSRSFTNEMREWVAGERGAIV